MDRLIRTGVALQTPRQMSDELAVLSNDEHALEYGLMTALRNLALATAFWSTDSVFVCATDSPDLGKIHIASCPLMCTRGTSTNASSL